MPTNGILNPLFFSLQYERIPGILKLHYTFLLSVLLGGLLFNACSTKKDAFINRNWHALNTKYNVLYNGNIAFEEGREQLNAAYQDDYWEVLPVERMEVVEEIELDSENNNPNFVIAEEKATKAIQKHSMDIENEERNPQTDESFLLLGKARYFDHRYIPALEAFNYILNKYTQSDKLNEATIWREKTNVRLDNEELALKNLKRLLKYEALKDQEYADARAVMAQAYINMNAPDTAIHQLKIASAYTRKDAEMGRYYYIIGQLYNQLGYKDSANYAFDKLIALNRKSPRIYMINAHIQKIQNTEVTEDNRDAMMVYLTDLETNRENRPYLDKIYREIAIVQMGSGKDSLALINYNKSLRATSNKPQLNALNYEDLAEYNFDRNSFKTAGAYFDSVLSNLPENTREYRATKKKFDNLEDVIAYEQVVQYADSVITVYHMPMEARTAYYEKHIAALEKAADEATREEEARATAGFATFAASQGGQENQGKFYFYNITSLGYGKTEFAGKWGKRPLEDDWRWSSKNKSAPSETIAQLIASDSTESKEMTEEERYSVVYYLDQIPTDITVIDSLQKERNFANYQLGLIYKEKFRENELAAEKLEEVLRSKPEERLILPSKYNLFKIYEELESPLANSMKQNIIQNHPESRYAEILVNPQAVLTDAADSPEANYAALYKRFQEQDFLYVITVAEEQINRLTGDPIVPKFEMLKANAIGRLQGFNDFREALNYVALNYPNNPEGKKAQQMIAEQLPNLEPKEFAAETAPGNWKVVFPFQRQHNDAALELEERLRKSIVDLKYRNIVSGDIYNLEEQFVVVHGFKSRDYALGYVELLKNNKDYRIDNENFVILSANYKIIQVHKNLQEYQDQFLTPKP